MKEVVGLITWTTMKPSRPVTRVVELGVPVSTTTSCDQRISTGAAKSMLTGLPGFPIEANAISGLASKPNAMTFADATSFRIVGLMLGTPY